MTADWQRLRAEFPAVEASVYLSTAAGGPMSRAAAAAGAEYYESTCRDGDVHWDAWLARIEDIRGSMATHLGCHRDELSFIANASVGLNLIAHRLYREHGACRVSLVRGDFPSVTLPWQQLGFDVDFIEPDTAGHGGVEIDALASGLAAETRVLAISWVHYSGGYRYRLDELAEVCRARDITLVVDVTQGCGAVRLDLSESSVDYAVSSGYKWLNAGYGVGYLYVNRKHARAASHPAVGWRSARDPYALVSDRLDITPAASALELGHPPFAGAFTLGAAIELARTIGMEHVERRVLDLGGYLLERLAEKGVRFQTPIDESRRAGIVMARPADPDSVEADLQRRGILASVRGGGLRISPHWYNTRSDIDRLVETF